MMLLATHSLRKDLGSPSQHEAGFALSYLACVSSPDLALDIGPDVLGLLQGSRAVVRRKATLALLRMVQRSPPMLRSAFRVLLERLEDSSPGVVTAAVCVLCELAMHDPPAFLPLAPTLVPLLTPQASPWLAIKLVKIIGALAQVEPRLIRKVQEPLTAVLESTPSKSLLLESVRCVLTCMPGNPALCQLALAKAAELLETGTPTCATLPSRRCSARCRTTPRTWRSTRGPSSRASTTPTPPSRASPCASWPPSSMSPPSSPPSPCSAPGCPPPACPWRPR